MSNSEQHQLPATSIWPQIAKLSISEDKPIMLDYWIDSLEKKVLIYGEIFYNNNLLLFKGSMNFFSDYFNYYRFINECNSSLLTHSFKIHHDIYNKNDLEFYYFKTSYDTFKFYKNKFILII